MTYNGMTFGCELYQQQLTIPHATIRMYGTIPNQKKCNNDIHKWAHEHPTSIIVPCPQPKNSSICTPLHYPTKKLWGIREHLDAPSGCLAQLGKSLNSQPCIVSPECYLHNGSGVLSGCTHTQLVNGHLHLQSVEYCMDIQAHFYFPSIPKQANIYCYPMLPILDIKIQMHGTVLLGHLVTQERANTYTRNLCLDTSHMITNLADRKESANSYILACIVYCTLERKTNNVNKLTRKKHIIKFRKFGHLFPCQVS